MPKLTPDNQSIAAGSEVLMAVPPPMTPGRKVPLRILFLAPQPFFQDRGTPIAERELLRVLSERGCEVDVLTSPEGADVELPRSTIYRVPALPGLHSFPPGFSPRKLVADSLMLVQCIAMVSRRRYDLIHAVEEAAFIALAAHRIYGIPYIYDMDSSLAQQMTEQISGLRPLQRTFDWFERLAIRGSTGVLAVCKSLEEIARRCDPAKLIARAEDVSMLDDDTSSGDRFCEVIGAPGPYVLYVGNLEAYQGIDLLIEGFQHTLARVPEARLVVIGGSEDRIDHYSAACARLGIASHVHFLGPRPLRQLGWYLRQADVLVSPRTRGLNTPMKIYSYLDSGCPVVATRLPTHTQVLDDDIACLVEPSADSMGDGIARLLENDELRRGLADRARARVRADFTPEAYRRKINRFYDAVEKARAPRE